MTRPGIVMLSCCLLLCGTASTTASVALPELDGRVIDWAIDESVLDGRSCAITALRTNSRADAVLRQFRRLWHQDDTTVGSRVQVVGRWTILSQPRADRLLVMQVRQAPGETRRIIVSACRWQPDITAETTDAFPRTAGSLSHLITRDASGQGDIAVHTRPTSVAQSARELSRQYVDAGWSVSVGSSEPSRRVLWFRRQRQTSVLVIVAADEGGSLVVSSRRVGDE